MENHSLKSTYSEVAVLLAAKFMALRYVDILVTTLHNFVICMRSYFRHHFINII